MQSSPDSPYQDLCSGRHRPRRPADARSWRQAEWLGTRLDSTADAPRTITATRDNDATQRERWAIFEDWSTGRGPSVPGWVIFPELLGHHAPRRTAPSTRHCEEMAPHCHRTARHDCKDVGPRQGRKSRRCSVVTSFFSAPSSCASSASPGVHGRRIQPSSHPMPPGLSGYVGLGYPTIAVYGITQNDSDRRERLEAHC